MDFKCIKCGHINDQVDSLKHMMKQGRSKVLSMYKYKNLKSTLLPSLFARKEKKLQSLV